MSFSDLMSSGRGPGVLGMLLALVVVAGFGCLFMFAFDERFAGGAQTIESRIAEQAKEIRRMETVISRGARTVDGFADLKLAAKELSSIRRENQYREGQIGSLRNGVKDANGKIRATTEDFEKYKDEYRTFVRGEAKGRVMESITTRDGKTYRNITIREVTAVGMQIRHADGFKRIPFEDLADEIQDLYQFDPKQKETVLAEEAAALARHEAAVSATHERLGEQKAGKKNESDQAEKEKNIRAIAMMEARVTSLAMEIESLERAIIAEKNKSFSHAPQMRGELAGKQKTLASLRTEIARLRSKAHMFPAGDVER